VQILNESKSGPTRLSQFKTVGSLASKEPSKQEEMKPGRFFAELKRRNVIRAAILYLGAVWALAQGIAQLGPSVGAPGWTTRWFLVAAAIGFPFWIAFAWFYEFTPEGLKRESEIEASSVTRHTGRKLDFTIIGVLTVAVVLLLTDRFVLRHVDETTVAPITENSIAVLPFVNMSEDRANEYFSDGISEELLNLLTKVSQLQVAARTSSFSFKGRQVEIPEIGRQLHVANVLEGSVRKSGDRVRITAQLIRAGEGFHLWSETYDRKLDDIFKIQDEIAAEVVKQLKVRLLGAAPTVRQTDPKGYMLYLQAVQLGRQNTPEAFAQSDELYRQVLQIDSRYAPAWRELSRNFTNEADAGLLSNSEGYARAREAGEKALAIDPNYASAHSGLGWIAMANHDFVNAAKHFERALALDSNDLSVLGNSAAFLQAMGRLEEALAIQQALVRRDPVNVTALYNLGYTQRVMGQYDAAIVTYRRVLGLSPGYASAHYQICIAMLLKNDASAALAEIEQENNEPSRLIGLPMVYHALGRKAESRIALATLIARFEKDWSYNIAQVYAFGEEADKAFEWLDKAVAYHDPGLSDIVRENLFDNIHSDLRWVPFLRKVGLAPEQLAGIQFKVTLQP
jgi:TolB-like protein/Flp pilus assembly protein TadD